MSYFSSRDRIGLTILMSLIVVLSGVYWGLDRLIKPEVSGQIMGDSLVIDLQHRMDSLKKAKQQRSTYKIYPFNPNYLTEYKAYRLGLSADEYERLKRFRAGNQWVNSARDFKRVTGVSDSLLAVIKPYFKFPDWVIRKQQQKMTQQQVTDNHKFQNIPKVSTPIAIKDLNTATKEELMNVRGIGDKLSDRIIKYRTKLKGFSYNDQLYEVWYLDKAVADEVLRYFKVKSKPDIQKINVNTATFKEVLNSSPYIDYKLTKKIFDYKYAAGKVTSMEVLKKLDSFPVDKFERISLYLTAE